MINFLEKIARGDFGIEEGKKLSFILFSNQGTSTALVFVENRFWPAGVLRISTSREHVTREHKVLKVIVERGNPWFVHTVPQPINIHFVGKRVISSQTFVPIEQMKVPRTWRSLAKGRIHYHLKSVRKWLSYLAKVPVKEEEIERSYNVSEIVDFIVDHKDIQNLQVSIQVLQSLERLQRFSPPQVINHKDLHVDNILWGEKGNLCVIDWEYSTIGYPMFDWFFFICDYGTRLFAKGNVKDEHIIWALKKVFLNNTWFSRVVFVETVGLCCDLFLPEELTPDFYILGVFDFLYRSLGHDLLRLEKALFLLDENVLQKWRGTSG